jgi:hypothetical protein
MNSLHFLPSSALKTGICRLQRLNVRIQKNFCPNAEISDRNLGGKTKRTTMKSISIHFVHVASYSPVQSHERPHADRQFSSDETFKPRSPSLVAER